MPSHEKTPDWVKGRLQPTKSGPGRPEKYPWSTTPVGGTFDIPPGPEQPKLTSVEMRCWKKRRNGDGDFICHRYPDGLIQVFRRG